jgi:N-acetylglucosaminyl-diphospho-decaprenol L-rhamnosyltransferase
VGLERVGVVVVTHQSASTVDRALAALPLDEVHVVVVDNASRDGSADLARRHGVIVHEQANLGFGAGNNAGTALLPASVDLVLFLNPDAVLERADLLLLVAHLDAHPEAAVVGPSVLSGGRPSWSSGRLDSLATELRPLLPAPLSSLGPRRRHDPARPRTGRVGYVEGACFLVRRSDLDDVGGFDEGYFLYCEELELARRLARRGREVHLCAEAVVEHAMGASTSSTPWGGSTHLVTSQVRYLRRWHGERAARTWVRAATASWSLRARTGRLPREQAAALAGAAREALRHAPPPAVP